MAQSLLEPGTYACPKHEDTQVTMYIRFQGAWCQKTRCGKLLLWVADLTKEDRKEIAADNRRADREAA